MRGFASWFGFLKELKKMAYKLESIIKEIMSILEKEGFEIKRMKGDHIIVNKVPSLKRPVVLVNEKKLSNVVRQNLIKECEEIGMDVTELKKLF